MKKTSAIIVVLACFVLMTGIFKPALAELYGELNGSKYENAFLGMGCDLPGWVFDTVSGAIVSSDNNQESVSGERDETNVVLMSANSSDLMQAVSIVIRNAADYQLIPEKVGIENAVKWMKDDFTKLFKTSNAYDVSTDTIDVLISGEHFYGLSAEFKYMTIPVYQKQLYFFRGDYLVFLSYRSCADDRTEDIINHFYLLETH